MIIAEIEAPVIFEEQVLPRRVDTSATLRARHRALPLYSRRNYDALRELEELFAAHKKKLFLRAARLTYRKFRKDYGWAESGAETLQHDCEMTVRDGIYYLQVSAADSRMLGPEEGMASRWGVLRETLHRLRTNFDRKYSRGPLGGNNNVAIYVTAPVAPASEGEKPAERLKLILH